MRHCGAAAVDRLDAAGGGAGRRRDRRHDHGCVRCGASGRDRRRSPIPGASIGGNQEAVTDARGTFQFIRLVPGVYTVKADLAGFRSAVQENIVVNADATARVDLKLEIGTLDGRRHS